MDHVKDFAAAFQGLSSAYITMTAAGKNGAGKNEGTYQTRREALTLDHYEAHLSGKSSLGIFLLNEESQVKFGCIDIDQYPLDHKKIIDFLLEKKLPLIVDRSKSGGAHCYLFSKEWMPAAKMREALRKIAAGMGLGDAEIFPKQEQISVDRGDVGSAINLPYFSHEDSLRHAFNDDGSAATLEEFLALYKKRVQTPEQVEALSVVEKQDFLVDGPPCLQVLLPKKISEGGRNNGLFNIGVYLQKVYPDSWETELMQWNMAYVDPPLGLTEIGVVVNQLKKKDYAYKCNDAPINSYCDRPTCLMRKFGIGGTASAAMANLRKYDSHPPIWFLDVNGTPIELDTEALMSQPSFQKACMEQLNFLPPTSTKQAWETRIAALLSELRDNAAAVIPVAEEESTKGIFYEYLRDFCVHFQQANSKEEILLGKPWTEDETATSYFRLRDLESYLQRNKFFEYKRQKVAQRLREIGGVHSKLRIQDSTVNVYKIPAFVSGKVDVGTPFEQKEFDDVPF
jgi:hypothetical protein